MRAAALVALGVVEAVVDGEGAVSEEAAVARTMAEAG